MNTDTPAFEGIRVVELAQWVFVPVAGALLADWGADVIRIEHPDGDPYRALSTQGVGADSQGVNLSVALANRGKRSMAIDLKSNQGRDVLHRLLSTADVFLTNLRPSALARLGLDAEQLCQRFPGLVYARGHGFGTKGPDANMAGYDASAYFARGGVADALTPADSDYPIYQRGAMGDRSAAMALGFAMSGALLRKARTGKGSVVDVSLLATAMWTLSSDVLTALNGQPIPRAERSKAVNPLTMTYRTADGRFISLMMLQADRYWPDLCRALAREDLMDDARFNSLQARRKHAAECVSLLEDEFGRRSFAECKSLLYSFDAPWAPVQTINEVLEDPQVVANGYIGELKNEDGTTAYRLPAVPVQFDGAGPPIRPAPELGEHTEQILLDLGYDWNAITDMKECGVLP